MPVYFTDKAREEYSSFFKDPKILLRIVFQKMIKFS